MQITISITGERPLLMHNGRLADPLDFYTRRIKSISKKRNKTDDDLAAMAQIEARGGCWETEDGHLGIPREAVWKCLYDAAKAYKLGEDVKRGLLFEPIVDRIRLDGVEVLCDEFLRDSDHVLYKSVRVQRARTMRARPRLPAGWTSAHEFELLTDVIDARNLAPVVERAGRLVGLGDWRPTYGRFSATVGGA